VITVERVSQIADILASAPPWARLALTSTDSRLRHQGADEVSAFLLRRLEKVEAAPDPRQFVLPISEGSW
jgi:hypothetical protein